MTAHLYNSRRAAKVLSLVALAVLGIFACESQKRPERLEAPTASPVSGGVSERPSVTVGEVTFEVEIAGTADEQSRGLSGRDGLAPGTGMLFVYQIPQVSIFWMKGMRFPLDFIWIDQDCEVADTGSNAPVPAPGTADSKLPLYRSAVTVLYGLEVNAGEVASLGIKPGDRVTFSDVSAAGDGC